MRVDAVGAQWNTGRMSSVLFMSRQACSTRIICL
jgi:hypothetical protein